MSELDHGVGRLADFRAPGFQKNQGMSEGVPMPTSELWKQAKPGGRSAAVRWAWMNDRGWKSLMGPVGGNQKPEATARGCGWRLTAVSPPVRACGVEARGESESRMQVNPRKAGLSGQACRSTRRPISNRGRTVVGAAATRSHSSLPQEISSGPATVEPEEATTMVRCLRRSRIAS